MPTKTESPPKAPRSVSPSVSVVIAALDEAENIGPVLDEIQQVFAGGVPFEIVVVDDGSADATPQVVEARAAKSGNIVLARHGRRRGKSAALGTGMRAASGRYVVTMDADGQDDPAEALKLVTALMAAPQPTPLVAGIRNRRTDGLARLAATRFANGLRKRLLNDDCVDTGCGLKAFERDLFLKFPMFEGLHRFLPAMAKAQGHPVLSIPIVQRERMSGESKYTNLGRAAVGAFDLLGAAWLSARARPENPFPRPASDNNRLPLWTYALLAAFAFLMFLPGQKTLPPFDRDESRYAQAVTQMLETGDLIDIHYQDQVRYLQPAGIYWLQAASVSAFSDVEARQIWAHRIPSLLGAVLAVLLSGWIGARAFGRGAGVIAALGMASCLLLGVEARMAKIDATLLAVTLAAQGLLLKAYLDRTRLPWLQAALFWVLLGAGLMLKGPIILIFVGLTMLSLSLWDRSGGWLLNLRPILLPLTFLVVAPWILAINAKTHGGFLQEALGHSLMGKVGGGQQKHGGPPGYHLLMFGLMFWPTGLFALLAAPWAWANRQVPAVRFMIAWIVPAWIVFEAVATKLPHYVLPTYPALAALAGAALLAPKVPLKGLWRVPGWIAAGFVALLGLLLPIAIAVLAFQYESTVKAAAVTVGALSALLWLWVVVRLARGGRDILTFGGAVLAAYILLPTAFGAVTPSLQRLWVSRGVDRVFDQVKPCTASRLSSAPYAEPSMVYLTATSTHLTDGAGAAADLLADPACGVALLGAPEEAPFLAGVAAAGRKAMPIGKVEGRNYADGNELKLTFYRVAP